VLQENLLSNSHRFVYDNLNKPPKMEVQPDTIDKTPSSTDDLTAGETLDRAVEDFFFSQLGSNVKKFKDFLTKMGEEGATKLHFEKDEVNYWKDGEQYRIPASFIREVENPSDQEELKGWLSKLGEEFASKLTFDESGISYWHEGKKYNIPAELLR
jgi:hypothetical protein